MSYVCELGTGQKLYLDNQGNQTIITMVSSSPGQQQQATNSFTTGNWTAVPQVLQSPTGIFLTIQTATGTQILQLQGSNLGVSNHLPNNAQKLNLEPAADVPSMSMKPMEPLKPMTMGDMSMTMQPMEMRMGNMTMKMPTTEAGTKGFCSQCGAQVKLEDRFCSSCGHSLN